MPTPRLHPSSYPQEYIELLRRALRSSNGVTVTLSSRENVIKRRNDLYALRRCLYANPSFDTELTLLVSNLTFTIDKNNLTVSRKADT